MEHGVDRCRMTDFLVVASGQLPSSFREWLREANDQMLFWISIKKQKKNKVRCLLGVFGLGRPLSEDDEGDVFRGVLTSSRRYLWRRHLGWHHPRWRRRKWRQPGLGENFSIPIAVAEENGGPSASGRHHIIPKPELRSSKMATGSGRAAIYRRRNGDRKVLPILLRGHT